MSPVATACPIAPVASHANCKVMVNPDIAIRQVPHGFTRLPAWIQPACACCRCEHQQDFQLEWTLNQWVLNRTDDELGSDWIYTLCDAHDVDLAAVLLKREGGRTLCSHCNRYSESFVGGFCSVACRDGARAAL